MLCGFSSEAMLLGNMGVGYCSDLLAAETDVSLALLFLPFHLSQWIT